MVPRSPRPGRIRPSTPRRSSRHQLARSRSRLGRPAVAVDADAHIILERVTDAFYALDEAWHFTYVNPAAERLLRRPSADLLGRNFWETYPDLEMTELGEAVRRAMGVGAPQVVEMFYPPLDGWFEIRVYPAANGVTVYFRNVTSQRLSAELLEQSEARYRHLVEQTPAVIYIETSGPPVSTSYISPFVQELLGDSAGEFLDDATLWTRRIHPHDRRQVESLASAADAVGERYTAEYRMVARDGHVVWVQDTATPMLDGEGRLTGWQGVVRDITVRKAIEDDLRRLAHRDVLTGLSNRAFLDERLGDLLASEPVGSVAVLFIDLDRFKLVNDAWGHTAGDTVLATMAQGLSVELGAAGTLSRFGGDEFVAAVPHTSVVDATRLAERLLAVLRRPVTIAGREVVVGGSIGIALNQPGQGVSDLTREASLAIRVAKGTGRDRVVLFEPQLDRAGEEFLLIADLRQAIERRDLTLAYQPIIDLTTGSVVTVEALLRWDHPQRGSISPARFIPLAEETGLIIPLGDWVIEAACRQLNLWDENTSLVAPPQININVAARQLLDPAFPGRVLAALARHGLTCDRIRLEISERTAPADLANLVPALETFHTHGISLSLDDFGAGTSSLALLRVLRAADLKLDHGFIHRLSGPGPDRTIMAGITSLAHALGMVVTAEGIETAEHLEAVRAVGCDRVQGWLFATEMSASDMTGWLAVRSPSRFPDRSAKPVPAGAGVGGRDEALRRPVSPSPSAPHPTVPGSQVPVAPGGPADPVVPDVVRAPVTPPRDADASGLIS